MPETPVKEMICIVCPNGCRLTVQTVAGEAKVTGNLCPKGVGFAREELTRPVRSLTTTVRVRGAALPVLPVRTDGAIPKEKWREAMARLAGVTVDAPVRCGDTVLEDLAGAGVRVIATCTLGREGGGA